MSIDAVSSLSQLETRLIAPEQQRLGTGQVSFAQWFDNQVDQTETRIQQAEQAAQSLALGEAENLHQVMIALDKAQISFELMVQVRNRLVEGVQEVMRMSI